MRRFNGGGFTIIEVIFFLALSSLMIIGAFAGFSSRLRSVRHTDSMRSLHSHLEQQSSRVLNGVGTPENQSCNIVGTSLDFSGVANPRGTNLDCLVIGTFFNFNPGSGDVTIELIASKRPAFNEASNDALLLSNYQAGSNTLIDRVIGPETYSIEWGHAYISGRNAVSNPIDGFGIIRGPISGAILAVEDASGDIRQATNLPYTFCFRDNDGQEAAIIVGAGGKIELDFEVSSC